MKTLCALLATTCVINISYAENANDVLHTIPGAKTPNPMTESNTASTQPVQTKKSAPLGNKTNVNNETSYTSNQQKTKPSEKS